MAQFIVGGIQILLVADGVQQILQLRPRGNTSHEQLTVGQAHLADKRPTNTVTSTFPTAAAAAAAAAVINQSNNQTIPPLVTCS